MLTPAPADAACIRPLTPLTLLPAPRSPSYLRHELGDSPGRNRSAAAAQLYELLSRLLGGRPQRTLEDAKAPLKASPLLLLLCQQACLGPALGGR